MSMQTYPLNEAAVVIITSDLAVLLNSQKRPATDGRLPGEMTREEILADFGDAEEVIDRLNQYSVNGAIRCSEFAGEAERFTVNGVDENTTISFDDDALYCIAANYAPSLFKAPYASFDELVNEFREKLEAAKYDVSGIDLAQYIYTICGTYIA